MRATYDLELTMPTGDCSRRCVGTTVCWLGVVSLGLEDSWQMISGGKRRQQLRFHEAKLWGMECRASRSVVCLG